MKTHLMLITGVAALAAKSCLGQKPFVNFFWEASDGGAWTRNQLTTTHQNVQIRIAAEWGAPTGFAFFRTGFDVVIGSSPVGDGVSNLLRPEPHGVPAMTPTAMRQGNLIKIDDDDDFDAPGEGIHWVQTAQWGPVFGGPIDQSNPAVIFRFDLQLADIQGTRRINSIHYVRNSTNSAVWFGGASAVYVLGTTFSVDVTYVPAPGCLALLPIGVVLSQRRRR